MTNEFQIGSLTELFDDIGPVLRFLVYGVLLFTLY